MYQESKEGKAGEDEGGESAFLLPDLNEGDVLDCVKTETKQKFTKPPLRYTDASIVKAMEDKGIGRPSTYASIIAVLTKRKYVEKQGKYMVPTPVAFEVTDLLMKYFTDIMDVKFTARMETKLDEIEEGNCDWHTIIETFYPSFSEKLQIAMDDGTELTDIVCEKCGGKMVRKIGRYGKYLACSNYPECSNRKSEATIEVSQTPCPKCGAMMVVKKGKFGKFLACPNYPECKSTLQLPADDKGGEKQESGVCPDCGKPVYARKSKTGKIFYGCSGYPDCKFMSWDLPTGSKCPKCGAPVVKTKRGVVRCSGKDCDYKEPKKREESNEG